MTGAERQSLRQTIDQQARARNEARAVMTRIIDRRKPRIAGHCIYCGRKTSGRACPAHRDLVQIELQAAA